MSRKQETQQKRIKLQQKVAACAKPNPESRICLSGILST
jgi:hypothetical protein